MSSATRPPFEAILIPFTYGKDAACAESINVSGDEDENRRALLQRQGRKMLKEKKNHDKKVWGTGRRAALHKAKKAQDD